MSKYKCQKCGGESEIRSGQCWIPCGGSMRTVGPNESPTEAQPQEGMTNDHLCSMIREAVKDRPDLISPAGMKYVRTEMLDGKKVYCYVEI